MADYMKLKPTPGARWAIGRSTVHGGFVALIESTPVTNSEEIREALLTLRLPYTRQILDTFFPLNSQGRRCPTFALMSLWYDLAPAPATAGKDKV